MLGRIRCMRPDQWGNQDTGLKDGGGSIFLKKKISFFKKQLSYLSLEGISILILVSWLYGYTY